MESTSRSLASLALFRQLYDQKNNVFEIVELFIEKICYDHKLVQFTEFTISDWMKRDYGFDLPPAVIKTASSKIKEVSRINGQFVFTEKNKYKEDGALSEISDSHDLIWNKLVHFVESKIENRLDEKEKRILTQSLGAFLLEETSSSKYSTYVGAFVLECSQDKGLYKQLQTIREGFVLYTGLEFEANVNELGSWIKPMIFYLDTEILFHSQGLNGDLFLSSFNDFYDYVLEINRKRAKTIQLKYFSSTKDEIIQYFNTARGIVENESARGPMKTAMQSIVNGCDAGSDVIIKEAQFFESLVGMGILEDDSDNYFDHDKHEYNLISSKKLEELTNRYNGYDKVERILGELNKINIKRGEHTPKYFEDSRYVFLTGKGITLSIAWDDELRESCKIPLATNLTFIINRFWFKLNKGFGTNTPVSFDVIKNAQILLSSKLNDSVASKYNILRDEAKSGKLNESQISSAIVRLRAESKKPEEINVSEIDEVIDLISEKSIDRYLLERDKLNLEIKAKSEENEKVNSLAEKLRQENIASQLRLEEETSKLRQERIKVLEGKKETLFALRSIKVSAENRVLKRTRIVDNWITFFLVMFIVVIVALILRFGWDLMEPITYLMSIIGTVALIIYLIQTGRSFNLFTTRDEYLKKLYSYEYKKMELNLKKLEELEAECKALEELLN
ncbi:MAG: hypothetical protein H6559_15345 [Lewinellaceae bacterium]|nr:hypothetical protein [Lewinellaceae bacterium]